MKILTDSNGKPYLDENGKALKNTEPTLVTKSITANGNYSAVDDNADGYSEVSVQTENKLNQYLTKTLIELNQDDLANITSISASQFALFPNLKTVDMPSSITTLGSSAFTKCGSLETISFSSGLSALPDYVCDMFSTVNNLKIVYLPSSIRSIGMYAFRNTGIESLYITDMDSFTSIVYGTYGSIMGLSTKLYVNGVEPTEYTYPNGTTEIKRYSLMLVKSLETILMPDTVTTIGEFAFDRCTSLKYIELSSGLISMNSMYIFRNNPLVVCKCKAVNPPTLGAYNAIGNNNTIIAIPYNSGTAYKTATNWSAQSAKMHGFGTFESGVALPTQTTDTNYTLTWYTSIEDMKSATNPITIGNGEEVYCTFA